jgi:hypothetical protein
MDAPAHTPPHTERSVAAQDDPLAEPPSGERALRLDQVLQLARLALEFAIVVGCFVVILSPGDGPEWSAAFGLLGAITASILHNLSRSS